MLQALIDKLSEITEEEQKYLNGEKNIEKKRYFTGNDNVVDRKKLFDGIGNNDKLVAIRTHTRFIDFPTHSHDYIEIMYVCSGEIVHIIEGKKTVLPKGGLLILNRHVEHFVMKAGEKDIGINLIVSPVLFESMVEKLRDYVMFSDFLIENMRDNGEARYLIFNIEAALPIENILESLVYMLVTENNAEPDILRISLELLISCLSHYPQSLINTIASESNTDKIRKQINEYISINYKTATLSELTTLIGFSEAYLCRWIRKNLNTTFKQLLQNKRFSAAQYLLRTTNLSAEDIAISVGYENTSYFYKQFNSRYKMTPSKWRKNKL